MKLSRRNEKQTGVAIATLMDGSIKEYPLYSMNILKEAYELLNIIPNIKNISYVLETLDLTSPKLLEEINEEKALKGYISEERVNELRSNFCGLHTLQSEFTRLTAVAYE